MTPTIGRIVRYVGLESNGSKEHPAIVTRVWSESTLNGEQFTCVNLTVFPDCGMPSVYGSVMLFRDKQNAINANAGAYAYFPSKIE